jgi:hypothetical protein
MLEPLVGHQRALKLEADEETKADAALRASVRDQGDWYVILVGGVTRGQEDSARDCKERARVAAVFIALNLRAPLPAPASTPTAAPPRKPAPAPPRAEPQRAPSMQVSLGGFASFAYAPRDQLAGGGGLALWLGFGLFRVGLESGAMSATQLAITPRADGGHVDLTRLPSALLGAALWRVSRVSLGPTLGLAVDVLRAQGRALDRTGSSWRANLGPVLGLRTETHLTDRWSLSALVSGSFYPRSYELRVEPEGRLAHTPHIWLAAQLGLLCRLR